MNENNQPQSQQTDIYMIISRRVKEHLASHKSIVGTIPRQDVEQLLECARRMHEKLYKVQEQQQPSHSPTEYFTDWLKNNDWHWNFCSNKWGTETENSNRIERFTHELAIEWHNSRPGATKLRAAEVNLPVVHSPTEQPGDAKHTPGQWKVDITFKKNGYYCTSLCSGDDGIIRPAIAEGLTREESIANAELIARAPALLSEVSTLRSKQAELVAENERLREVLEGVLRLEDLIRYPDTVLPAQHQGEAEAINLMLDKIKAALTTTPKP